MKIQGLLISFLDLGPAAIHIPTGNNANNDYPEKCNRVLFCEYRLDLPVLASIYKVISAHLFDDML